MQSVIKSPEAEEDLIDIWLYIAEDSPVNSDRFLDRLEGMRPARMSSDTMYA